MQLKPVDPCDINRPQCVQLDLLVVLLVLPLVNGFVHCASD